MTSTATIISQIIIITNRRLPNINSRGASRVANSNGSIMQKTEKELPTGIVPQPKNTTRGLQHKLPREMHTVDGLSRGNRVRQARPLPVEAVSRAEEHSAAWTEAIVQKTSAAGGNRAAKACPAAVAGPVVVPAVAVAAEEGDNHVNITIKNNETGEGGRNDTSGNTG